MIVPQKNTSISFLLIILATFLGSCKKDAGEANPVANFRLSYGDSVLYQKDSRTDYLVSPANSDTGTYSAFPEGIEIDENTGVINVSKSEMGLRYKISFIRNSDSKTYNTTVLLSGINYLDAFYYLSKNDTVASPIYNGNVQNAIPVGSSGTSFDIDQGCNNEGIAVNPKNGRINLIQTIRNGFFRRHSDNYKRGEFELNYRIDDDSHRSLNGLKIKLYYFETINDVTSDLIQLINDRQGTLFSANTNHLSGEILSSANQVIGATQAARPRPPCIFIIGR